MKVLILLGTMYNENLGVSALTVSAVNIFEKVAQRLNISNEYIFLGTDFKGAKKDILDINGMQIEYNFLPMAEYINKKTLISSKYRNLITRSDIVIDLGGGDSFTDIYGINRYIRVVFLLKIIPIMKGKKFILMPQTIGPFERFWTRAIANSLMKKIPLIYPRDKQSKNYLDKYIGGKEYHEIIDMAFTLPFKKPTRAKEDVIGINVSGLLWNGGYTDIKVDYQSLVKRLITFFLNSNIKVILVGHVVTQVGQVSGIEDDYAVNERIQSIFPSIDIAPRFTSPVEAKSFISGLDFFTGSRMHACIAAYSSGVPVVPIAYSRKFNGMFQGTLEYNYFADAVNDTTDEVYNKVISGYEQRVQLLEKIRETQPLIDKKIQFLVDDICNYVSENK